MKNMARPALFREKTRKTEGIYKSTKIDKQNLRRQIDKQTDLLKEQDNKTLNRNH